MAEFDKYADGYADALQQGLKYSGEVSAYFAMARVRWLAGRLEQLGFAPRALLDFGCGTGASTPFFLSALNVIQVTGVDASPRLVDIATRAHGSGKARFVVRDDYQPNGRVDLVFCNGVFHHIPLSDRAEALAFVSRALSPGGLFAFWENNPWNPATRFVMSRIPFDRDAITISPAEARRLLRNAGFQIVRSDYLFLFPRVLRWLRPLERLVVGVPLGAQYLVLARKP